MTAINMMVQPAARTGFIISDGAHTHPDGRLTANSSKVIYSVKGFPWAMGITGNVAPATLLQTLGKASPLTLVLITAQRERGQILNLPGCEAGHCRIGGDVDLTEVTKHGVKVWKIHEWPDVVGERIAA